VKGSTILQRALHAYLILRHSLVVSTLDHYPHPYPSPAIRPSHHRPRHVPSPHFAHVGVVGGSVGWWGWLGWWRAKWAMIMLRREDEERVFQLGRARRWW